MANKGFPDDDGSRTPSGQHDEGRQRVGIYDTCHVKAATNADMFMGDPENTIVSSGGDHVLPSRMPVDGNSNTSGRFVPADYPGGTSY